MFKDPQPMGTAHLPTAEDESRVNVVSDQEKGKNSMLLKISFRRLREIFHKRICYSSLTNQDVFPRTHVQSLMW